MPSLNGVPTAQLATNGTEESLNGYSRPETPTGGMALTEYSINPSPPSEEKRNRIKALVPEDYLLPNGYPDVREPAHTPNYGLHRSDEKTISTCA